MNICKRCGIRYYAAAAHINCAKNNGGAHTPKYDFTLDDNVLNCEIV